MTTKITQVQMRVLRHKMECMAREACLAAETDYREREKELTKQSEAIVGKMLNKHRKALASTLRASISTWRSITFQVGLSIQTPEYEAFAAECHAAIKKAGLEKITEETAYVYIPSLGLTDRRGNDHALRVPLPQKDKWQKLGDQIDAAFMSGDAVKLLEIINAFV